MKIRYYKSGEKARVGDCIRCVEAGPRYAIKVGNLYTVENIPDDGYLDLVGGGVLRGWSAIRFVLVSRAEGK